MLQVYKLTLQYISLKTNCGAEEFGEAQPISYRA